MVPLRRLGSPSWRSWWGRGDSNSHASRHMILNHARLPIPTLPQKRRPTARAGLPDAKLYALPMSPVHAGGRRECWGAAQRSGACLRLTHLGRGCKVFRS